MKIGFLNNKFVKNKRINNFSKNNSISYPLKLKSQLKADTINFGSEKIKDEFKTEEELENYLTELRNSVNALLEDNNDIEAFKILGHNTYQDPKTHEIILEGYLPFISIRINGKKPIFKSYTELGINQNKLLRNVVSIKTSINNAKEFIKERDNLIKEALDDNDYKKAFDLIGSEIDISKNGKITILDSYSYCGKYEKELLENVGRINGYARFQTSDSINRQIALKSAKESSKVDLADEIISKIIQQRPKFKDFKKELDEAVENNEQLKLYELLGMDICFNTRHDKNPKIQKLDFKRAWHFGHKNGFVSFEALGLGNNREFLDKYVKRVKNLILTDDSVQSLKGIEVDYIEPYSKEQYENLTKGYCSTEEVTETLKLPEEVSKSVIDCWFKEKFSIKNPESEKVDKYYDLNDNINKRSIEFIIKNITDRRDKVLSVKELADKMKCTEQMIRYAVANGYLSFIKSSFNNSPIKMIDITNRENSNYMEILSEKKSNRRVQECCINSLKENYEDFDIKHFPQQALQRLGYGTKEDLIANAIKTFSINFYQLQRYIQNNDFYNLARGDMRALCDITRKNNPALIKYIDLRKINPLIDNDIVKGKLNVITNNPWHYTEPEEYYIDISDNKNNEYFENCNIDKIKRIYERKKGEYNLYKAENKAIYEEFKSRKEAPKYLEARAILNSLIDKKEDIDIQQRLSALIKKQERKEQISMDRSLSWTIAWSLSPNTRKAQAEIINPKMKELLAKYKETSKINKLVLLGELSQQKAKELTDKIDLSEEEKIAVLGFYKRSWELSGTEEWINATKKAQEILKIYKEQGITGIEDEYIKNIILKWEEKQKVKK